MDFDHKFHRGTVFRTSSGPCGFLSKIRRSRLAKSRSHGPEDRVTGRLRQRANALSGRWNFKLLTCDTVLRTVREALPFANRANCKIQSLQHGLQALEAPVTTEFTGPRKNAPDPVTAGPADLFGNQYPDRIRRRRGADPGIPADPAAHPGEFRSGTPITPSLACSGIGQINPCRMWLNRERSNRAGIIATSLAGVGRRCVFRSMITIPDRPVRSHSDTTAPVPVRS